ncbi:MAG: hypothetical protein G01um10143_541 [Parcubacteria group bacterium Gr01-1014_3]|nr:MAG: hypothetical protein G01um10143_541 [Parcubacteria group bacterium Gr01-1014_3]
MIENATFVTWVAGVMAVGAIGFWILVALEFICLITCMAKDKGTWATVSLIATCAILNWVSGMPLLHWVAGHFWLALAYAGGYFVAGTVWSVVKWYSYVTDQRERYDEMKDAFFKNYNLNAITADNRTAWKRWLDDGHESGKGCGRTRCKCVGQPLARNHKDDVIRWMSYWPFSLLWTVLFNWVVKVCHKIYQHIQASLQRISDYKFKDTASDFTDEQPDAKVADKDAKP